MDNNTVTKIEYEHSIFDEITFERTQQQYKIYLHNKLSQASSYQEFMGKISHELESRFGIIDWAYSMLNLPDKLTILENFGTIDRNYISEYLETKMYEHDLLLHHTKLKNTHRFQSDVIKAVEDSNFESYDNIHYQKLYSKNIKFGFKEICCIPTISSIDGNRCLFSVTSRGIIETVKFKQNVLKNINYLTSLAMAINDIGLRFHRDYFLKPLKEYKILANSQPLNLLATMGKYDLDTSEGAQRLGIAYNTAKNHLVKIKQSLGATTIHGAYDQAIKCGLIV